MNQLRDLMIERYGENNLPSELRILENASDKKLQDLSDSILSIEKTAEALALKVMILLAAPKENPLLLGDNPVTVFNSTDTSNVFGNLGILSKGSEICMPISPDLAIAFWCPTICQGLMEQASIIHEKLERVVAMRNLASAALRPQILEQEELIKGSLKTIEAVSTAIESGQPLRMAPENVLHHNSLQISHAERYVLSSTGNFSLVHEMLDANPRYIQGRRMIVR